MTARGKTRTAPAPDRDAPPELIEMREVVRRTGLTPDWVRRKVQTGDFALPLVVVDRTTLWRREPVEHWLRTGTWPAGTPVTPRERATR